MTNQQPPDIIEIGGVKYQRVEKPKPQTLYDIIYKWKYNTCDPTCKKLVDMIEEWLPKLSELDEHTHGYTKGCVEGWNDCIEELKTRLREL